MELTRSRDPLCGRIVLTTYPRNIPTTTERNNHELYVIMMSMNIYPKNTCVKHNYNLLVDLRTCKNRITLQHCSNVWYVGQSALAEEMRHVNLEAAIISMVQLEILLEIATFTGTSKR